MWASEPARIVWPIFLSTRLGVLAVGFFGIALLGYAPNTPPWRVYTNDFLNLPARWDTGWYLGVAIDGYNFEHTREVRQQNIAFFPLYPMLLRYVSPFFAHQVPLGRAGDFADRVSVGAGLHVSARARATR